MFYCICERNINENRGKMKKGILLILLFSLIFISSVNALNQSESPYLISKGKNYIMWEWNKTNVNYTILDGIPIILNNGMYIYSNLLPNSTHILTISYDGINKNSSTVTTDKDYDYDIWIVPLIGVAFILGFIFTPILTFMGFLILLFNLVINQNQFNDIEKILNMLLIIIGVLLFKFKFGDL